MILIVVNKNVPLFFLGMTLLGPPDGTMRYSSGFSPSSNIA